MHDQSVMGDCACFLFQLIRQQLATGLKFMVYVQRMF